MEEKILKIKSAYEELKGALNSINDQSTWMDDDGFSEHTNRIIDRVGEYCDLIDSVEEYKIKPRFLQGRDMIIDVIPAKTKISSLLGRIKGLYNLSETDSFTTGHTFIQQQNQSQEQHQAIILDIQERIIQEIEKHEEGTKERSFLEKLKSSLPTMGSTLSIIASILSIASEFNLDAEAVKKLLNL